VDKQKTRRLLIVAFALSLLIHAILASRVWWTFRVLPDEETVVRVQAIRIAHAARTPPPTPPPAPQATARATAAASAVPRPLGTAPGPPAPAARSTPPPTPHPAAPSASPPMLCAGQDEPVTIVSPPPPPDLTPDQRSAAYTGVARVRVDVDANGAVTGTAVVDSTGKDELDLVAVSAARAARYAPATHACKPVAGSYVFALRFFAW
jgi:TonB family protein